MNDFTSGAKRGLGFVLVVGIFVFFLIKIKAWSGPDGLTADSGDLLSSTKWNSLKSSIPSLNTLVFQSTSSLSMSDHQTYTLMPGMSMDFVAGNNGSIFGSAKCGYYPGQPQLRININNGSSYKHIATDTAGGGTSHVSSSFLLTGFAQGSTNNIKLEIGNGATPAFSVGYCESILLYW